MYWGWNTSWSIFFKNFGTSRIDLYTEFWQFFATGSKFRVMYQSDIESLYENPLIWAVAELSGMNRSQDMVVLRFWKILGYEKFFIFLDFWDWKWFPIAKLMIFFGRGLWTFFCQNFAKKRWKIKIFEKNFLNDLAAAYSLSFKLGNNLLLCKISASNSQ